MAFDFCFGNWRVFLSRVPGPRFTVSATCRTASMFWSESIMDGPEYTTVLSLVGSCGDAEGAAGMARNAAPEIARHARRVRSLRQYRLVKLVPIVQIVQVHRDFRRRSVIGNVARTQDSLAGFVVVIVAAHRSIVLFDGVPIQ